MRELTYFPLYESYPKTSGYGYRIDPITGAQGSFHRGVDYGAPFGAPVIAPFDGQVTTGYEGGGAGNWSWVVNGGDMFKSFHHDSSEIGGGWVSAGTTIAWIDSTGSSTGSHAHFELWENGVNIDPTGYFDRAPLYGGGGSGGGGGSTSGEEMTDAEWNKMASMLHTMIVGKMSAHTTPVALLHDNMGQFAIVWKDGRPHRYLFGPDESSMAAKIGLIAPNKPTNPPAPSPAAYNVADLTQAERDILYGYPMV